MSWKPWTEKGADVSKLHSALKHTPYDGSAKPFTIGLQQLDLKDWIEADEHLPAYLDEKERLFAAYPNKVFVEESGTRHAQREVLDLLAAHLVHVEGTDLPDARFVGALAALRGGALDPAELDPLYVRAPDIGPPVPRVPSA